MYMSKQITAILKENHGMVLVFSYGTLFAVNALVIYFANMWFPMNVVLGTISISLLWAVVLSAGALALINTLSIPFFHQWEMQRNRVLNSTEWMIGYFFVNCIGIWLITRVAEIFGMGVSSWVVIIFLALTLDILQGTAMMGLEQAKK